MAILKAKKEDKSSHGHDPITKETYPVHIELKGKSLSGDVYVTGNQDALANWNPMGVMMKQIIDFTYTIDLNLRLVSIKAYCILPGNC